MNHRGMGQRQWYPFHSACALSTNLALSVDIEGRARTIKSLVPLEVDTRIEPRLGCDETWEGERLEDTFDSRMIVDSLQ